jgi:hypothetical protein
MKPHIHMRISVTFSMMSSLDIGEDFDGTGQSDVIILALLADKQSASPEIP